MKPIEIFQASAFAVSVVLAFAIALASCGDEGGGGDEVPQDGGGRPPMGETLQHVDRPGHSLRIGFDVPLQAL